MLATFWKKFALFTLPLGVLVGVPAVVLIASGELTSTKSVIDRQLRGEPVLFGPVYTNLVKPFKCATTQRRQPEVIALGSSRVMQFRASFFDAPQTFYNAGGAVNTIVDVSPFLRCVPAASRSPIVILALDQWFFNPRWQRDLGVPNFDETMDPLGVVQARWKDVYTDLAHHKISFPRLWDAKDAVGLNAIMKQRGFRNDGSYSYGDLEHCDDCEVDFADTLQRIASGQRRFEWGADVDRLALDEVDRVLEIAAAKNIQVVGLLPPFAPSVWSHLRASDRYGYIDALRIQLPAIFARRGRQLFDFSDPDSIGAVDAEFIDGFHGSERTYVRMLLKMAAATPALESRLSRASLVERLARAGRYGVPDAAGPTAGGGAGSR